MLKVLMEAFGYFGTRPLKLRIAECSQHTITSLIFSPHVKWLYSVVYASSHPLPRQQHWNYLDGFQNISSLPWLVAGDFNEIPHLCEKKGSNTPIRSTGFNSWINRNGLIDLGFIGAAYSWCKSNQNDQMIWERPDHSVCDPSWRLTFLEAFIRHLSRLYSDHSLLLIGPESNMVLSLQRCPF